MTGVPPISGEGVWGQALPPTEMFSAACPLLKMMKFLHRPEVAAVVGKTLPIPLLAGTKTPARKHSTKPWSWEKLALFTDEFPTHRDYGLLLDNLCAIDADNAEMVDVLEELRVAHNLEEMNNCPMQLTARGQHLIFLRPSWADNEGFYDGAAQNPAISEIDFKSKCSTGSRGVLCIAPSKDKSWAPGRAPWDASWKPMSLRPCPSG